MSGTDELTRQALLSMGDRKAALPKVPMKPRVYKDVQGPDNPETCWWVQFQYKLAVGPGWGTIRQGFVEWQDAFTFAYLEAVTARLENRNG